MTTSIAGATFVLQRIYGLSAAEFSLVFATNSVGIIACGQIGARLSLELAACSGAGTGPYPQLRRRPGRGDHRLLRCWILGPGGVTVRHGELGRDGLPDCLRPCPDGLPQQAGAAIRALRAGSVHRGCSRCAALSSGCAAKGQQSRSGSLCWPRAPPRAQCSSHWWCRPCAQAGIVVVMDLPPTSVAVHHHNRRLPGCGGDWTRASVGRRASRPASSPASAGVRLAF